MQINIMTQCVKFKFTKRFRAVHPIAAAYKRTARQNVLPGCSGFTGTRRYASFFLRMPLKAWIVRKDLRSLIS